MAQTMTAGDRSQIINIANKFQFEAQTKDGTGNDVYNKQIKLLHVPSGSLVFLDKEKDYRRSGFFKICVHPKQFADSICDGTNISLWKSTNKINPRLTPHSAFQGFPVDIGISKEPLGTCYRVKGGFPTLEALFRKLEVAWESTGTGLISFESDLALENETFPDTSANSIRQPISLEELQAQLDRRSEIGEAGERIALKYERRRLSEDIGCPDPEHYVKHVALTDVGRGYDIESTWPGHERCIEVKSSTSSSNDIFMSDNEKRVLTELGDKAWLYRVVVDANGDGEVMLRLNNPVSEIPEENFSAAVWRVRLPPPDK